jgi:membrane-bound lytic murein transglycosylase F
MNFADKGKWLQSCSLVTALLILLNSIIFQGCSQPITSASFVQKTGNPVESLTETVIPDQPSPLNFIRPSGFERYIPLVKKYAQKYDIDWILVLSIMKQESRFDHAAISYSGAYGLMQIMPLTQIELAEKLGVEETITPRNNIKAGVFHLRTLLNYFNDVPKLDRIYLTLAAYNAGLGRIIDAQQIASYMGNDPTRWTSIRSALPFLTKKNYTLHSRIWSNGYPPSGYFRNPNQTIEYVDNIMNAYDRYSLALK